jgi:hypothetical protein
MCEIDAGIGRQIPAQATPHPWGVSRPYSKTVEKRCGKTIHTYMNGELTMTKNEENRLTMYKSVHSFLQENATATSAIPILTTLGGELGRIITEIEQLHSAHQSVAKGRAAEKEAIEDRMIEQLVATAAGLYVWAVQQSNMNVRDVAKVTPSALKRMRDTELLVRAQTISQYLEQSLSELADYGVTTAMVERLKSTITEYDAALAGTGSSAAKKTTQRGQLGGAFDHMDDLLHNRLDPMMEVFRSTEKNLYNEYMNTRVIRDL